jgi:YVTN family beta-propeller protein
MNGYKTKLIVIFSLHIFFFCQVISISGQTLQDIEAKRIHLPNGWAITNVGKSLPLGDLPLNIAVSHSKKLIAITNNGQSTQSILLIDAVNHRILDSINIGKSWLGLCFSSNDKGIYASGGNDNWIIYYKIENYRLKPADTIKLDKPWPLKVSPAGMDIDDKKQIMYVVTKENNSLYSLDLKTKKVTGKYELPAEGYTCLLSEKSHKLYISCWGCRKVLIFDTKTLKFNEAIGVGDHPNDMCISKNEQFLYVANANDNSVSVIDMKIGRVVETLDVSLYPNAPSGSTTNSVALSKDEKTLYIANADNNCLAVFDVTRPGFSKGKGFIPAGWYPTCVRIIKDNIFVANGKGLSSMANPKGPNPARKAEAVTYQQGKPIQEKEQYIGGLFKGTLSIMQEPDEKQLGIYSKAVYNNTPYNKTKETTSEGQPGNPIPMKVGDISPIKYIFYIIKENRTYDQVLADIPGGNGDLGLLLFGEKITPNQHALAKEFVLLDNFYVDGEVSADGHNWSTGAYATDFLEKNWPTSYGGRGGEYNAEGTRLIANNKNGFIWDFCSRKGVTFRTYGEFADDYKPNIPVLKGHLCTHFTSWDQKVRDTTRFYQWKRDFDSLLKAGNIPQLNTIRFINDHTEGMRKDRPTPFAHVADNDLAVGMFVDYLSHSPVWKESAVFILEDDAQNGPDHVDAHRTTAYVAGGFVRTGFIDHTMYSTSSMLRTIELILGLPPMSQYDAAAMPMWRCFADTANHKPFKAKLININLDDKNLAMNKWQKMSDEFDWTMEDRAPDILLNDIIWVAVKGENTPCPVPKRAAFLKDANLKDDEKD